MSQQPPFMYLQLKGTHICLDLTCDCGTLSHADGEYCYSFSCEGCGKEYRVPEILYPSVVKPGEITTEGHVASPYEPSEGEPWRGKKKPT